MNDYYIVATNWPNEEDGLCIYTYGSELQVGLSQAEWVRDRAEGFSKREGENNKYDIYKVELKKV
jgi:hypothetical protein